MNPQREADLEVIENSLITISREIGERVGIRVYLSILDASGCTIFQNSHLKEQFEDFSMMLSQFIPYLDEKEYSIPFSNKNLMFYKPTKKTVLVIFSERGKIGQLFSCKKIINKYSSELDEIVEKIQLNVKKIEEKPLIHLKKPQIKILKKEKIPLDIKLSGSIENFMMSLDEHKILQSCRNNKSIYEMSKEFNKSIGEINELIFNFLNKGIIRILNHEILQATCQVCKNRFYFYLPNYVFGKGATNVAIELKSSCDHHNFLKIQKIGTKFKIKSKNFESICPITNELDSSSSNLTDLVNYVGQNIFLSIFHALFFKFKIVIVSDDFFPNLLTNHLSRIFPKLKLGQDVIIKTKEQFSINEKDYGEFLIIDVNNNLIINEPYEEEQEFVTEFTILKKVMVKDKEKMAFLLINEEFEKLLYLTEEIIEIFKINGAISPEDLKQKVHDRFGVFIKEIDLKMIKNLAKKYYDVNISLTNLNNLLGLGEKKIDFKKVLSKL